MEWQTINSYSSVWAVSLAGDQGLAMLSTVGIAMKFSSISDFLDSPERTGFQIAVASALGSLCVPMTHVPRLSDSVRQDMCESPTTV
jgi:hypothetical protein